MGLIYNQIIRWTRRLKVDVIALWIAAQDERTPLIAKLVAGAVAAYAFSPIDLIPDFLPIIGQLDDLVILPRGIWLAIRLIPSVLMIEFRDLAKAQSERPTSAKAAFAILAFWFVAILVGAMLAWPLIRAKLWGRVN